MAKGLHAVTPNQSHWNESTAERLIRQSRVTPEATRGAHQMGILKYLFKHTRTQMPAHTVMAPARQLRHVGTTVICPFTNMLPKKHAYVFF